MVAASVTCRDALEVSLVVEVVLSFVGGRARQQRPLRVATGAKFFVWRRDRRWNGGVRRGPVQRGLATAVAPVLRLFGAAAIVLFGRLDPSPLGGDRGMIAITTVLGIIMIALIALLAIRRGQFRPRPPRVIPTATVAWWSR